ncbi:MAG TPA: GNAT family N-acetyltransferase [Bacteroidota bacterium]|nr:GNAT family N-acetyltransferase [Bacteroidota bacterium]
MKNIKLEKLSGNTNEWEQFLSQIDNSTLFNSSLWGKIINQIFNISNEVIIFHNNGIILAGAIIYYKKRYFIKTITKPPLTLYNGLLFNLPENQKNQKNIEIKHEISNNFINYLSKEYKFINFTTTIDFFDTRPFLWNKWIVLPQYTYILNLEDEKNIWNGFSSSLRRKINNCLSYSPVISKNDNVEKLIDLHFESYSRNKIKPILDYDTFTNFVKLALENNICDIYSISIDNEIHSMRALLKWKDIIYDWIAGTETKYRNYNSTHFLLWELLKKYSNDNKRLFDFMGANTKSISDFKRLFGGELKEYYDLKYYSSNLFKSVEKISNFIKIRSRLKG